MFAMPVSAHEPVQPLPDTAHAELKRNEFFEQCYDLDQGQSIVYFLSSDKYGDFNIHYHDGEDTLYLAEQAAVRQADGVADIPVSTEICLMWRNISFGGPAQLDYEVKYPDGNDVKQSLPETE
ncbi:MAG: hypothetical protein H6869_09310 [Rhodospirillales bacterium]|nr:hypothetical protein [Rhodospirillales bacterium]